MSDDSLPLEVPDDADDVQVENAPVRRRRLAGLTIEGYSRAAMQSYWRIPELKLGFDFGLQPWAFMTTPTWAVSHTHMDHIAALPIYVARRRLMKMPEPTIYLPEGSVEDVRALLRAFQRLDRGRLVAEHLAPGQSRLHRHWHAPHRVLPVARGVVRPGQGHHQELTCGR